MKLTIDWGNPKAFSETFTWIQWIQWMFVVCSAFHHRFSTPGDFSTAMQRWADGDATHDAGARSIAEVVKAARAMTGKPAKASDEEPVLSCQSLQ